MKIITGLSLSILLKISIFVGRSLSEQCRERAKFISVLGFSRETEPMREEGAGRLHRIGCHDYRAGSPKICKVSQQAGRPRRGDGLVSVQRLAGLTPRKSRCFSLKAVGQEKLSLTERVSLLGLCRPSTD